MRQFYSAARIRLLLAVLMILLFLSTGLRVRADEKILLPNPYETEESGDPDWWEPTDPTIPEEPIITPQPVITPDQVENLKWEKITATKIKFNWYPLYYRADGYQIAIYDTTTKKYTVVRSISDGYAREATVKNLKPSTKYKFAIRAYVKANDKKYYGKYSEKLTLKTAPAGTDMKTVSYSSKGTLNVTWKKNAKADGYILQYSTSKKFKDDGHTTTVFVKKGATVSKKISGLAQTTYYVRVSPFSKNEEYYVFDKWSKSMSASVKQGCSLKELINHQKTDEAARKDILELTNNGVDIKKYSSTYDRVRAIFHWHAVHNDEFVHCLACNSNFNDCLFALFGYPSAPTLWIAGNAYINNSGSTVMHKWSTVYLAGVPYYFDPRMQGYTDKSGYSYFGFSPKSSLSKKHYIFDGWVMCTNSWRYY